MRATTLRCIQILLLVLVSALPARAQAEGPVGVRAAGMAGAFTAIADDASSVFWNPAGLASGSFFSLVLDHNSMERGSGTGDRGSGTGDRASGTLIALGTPPLGVSYYRTSADGLPATGQSFVAHHAGVTVVQSLGDRAAVGATLKLVRGDVSSTSGSRSDNEFDTDVGLMTTGSFARLGLTVRNVFEPEFQAPDGTAVTLERRIRAGLALNLTRRTVAAADFDLTTAETPRGEWRDAAVGLEAAPARKLWIRGGVRWNTADGPSAPIGTVGGSVAVYGSTMADAQVSFGSEDGNRGWGVGLRFVF